MFILGLCEKERILNHLEGLNLLPSLEVILNDYFAYQGPEEVSTDKVYMLWKQLDVVVGQLRAITLGRSKSKAFMNSRRAPKTYNKLLNKAGDTNQASINQYMVNATTHFNSEIIDLQSTQKMPYKEMETKTNYVTSKDTSEKTIQNKLLTPIKDGLNENNKKEFKSPRRKPRNPRRNITSDVPTEGKMKNSIAEVTSDAPLSKEFSDLVAALISNDKLSIKLADNINKVVSVETKPPSKEDEDIVDEIIKLTADDPDLNILFSMLGGHQYSSQEATQHVSNQFGINNAVESTALNMVTSQADSYVELQPVVTAMSNTQIDVVDSNLPPAFTDLQPADTTDTNLQPFLHPYSHILEMITPYNEYSCIRNLDGEFSDYTDKIPTPYEPLNLPEPLKGLQEKSNKLKTVEEIPASTQHQYEKNLSSPPKELLKSLVPEALCEDMNDTAGVVGDAKKAKVDDSEILASHALLQLSTSPMKLSPSSNIENVISKPVSPQALNSNGKISREPICSTNYTKTDIVNEVLIHTDQIIISKDSSSSPDFNQSNEMCTTQGKPSKNNTLSDSVNSNGQTRKKRTKMKSSNTETLRDNITVSLLDTEDTTYKKPKRSKEIMVTQLDFNPTIPSIPVNRSNQSRNKTIDGKGINNPIFVESGDNLLTTSALSSSRSPTSIAINISPKIVVTGKCDALSPACLLHAQFNSLISKNSEVDVELNNTSVSSILIENNEIPISVEVPVTTECSIVKPCLDQFQKFRIESNAISKVCSLHNNNNNNKYNLENASSDTTFSCKSKTISMVINNTDSLSKITSGISFGKSSPAKKSFPSSNQPVISSKDVNNLRCESQVMIVPSQHYISNMGSVIPSITSDSDSIINVRKKRCISSTLTCDIPSEIMEKDAVVSKVTTDNTLDTVTSKSVGDIPIFRKEKNVSTSKLDSDLPSEEREEGTSTWVSDSPSEKRTKDNVTSCEQVSSNSSKKRERSNRNNPSKRMTVKFNFKKSAATPMKKGFNLEMEDLKKEVEDEEVIYANYDTHDEVLQEKEDIGSSEVMSGYINPVISTIDIGPSDNSSIENQENVCTDSVLDCLKTSCHIQVSSSNILHGDNLTKSDTRTSIPCHNPHISNTTAVATVDIMGDSSCTSQSSLSQIEKNDKQKVSKQLTEKMIKRKEKRKRNLSLLMLNVDNVAQLLSGIDYS